MKQNRKNGNMLVLQALLGLVIPKSQDGGMCRIEKRKYASLAGARVVGTGNPQVTGWGRIHAIHRGP
jgi:hypothetical protein